MKSSLSLSLVVVIVAILVGLVYQRHRERSHRRQHPPDDGFDVVNYPSTTVYVIGDLHGDADCARQWLQRTQLIDTTTLEWKNTTSHLVFLGDYVDKGIQSRQTVEFVKELTERYPQQVTALLGNHELELLRDRTEAIWGGSTAGYFQLPYAATHPAEYLNYISDTNDDSLDRDRIVVDALYNASIEIYGRGLQRSVFFVPDLSHKGSVLHLIPDHLRSVVHERLLVFQKSYLDAYRTGTDLGTWLETRPIVKILHGTIFMHGGLSRDTAPYVQSESHVQHLNEQFQRNAVESRLQTFLTTTALGRAVYDILVYRGNHKEGACEWLPDVLPSNVHQLAIGHTPSSSVRINNCDAETSGMNMAHPKNYRILALDSALSRWFRNSGNNYCSGERLYKSSNQQYTCRKIVNHCQGQIVRILHYQSSSESKEPQPAHVEVLTI
jgi:Calcineurin-like phosphoesterase